MRTTSASRRWPTLSVSAPQTLQRTFREVIGITPRVYARERRLDQFRDELRNGSDVSRAIYGAGFSSPSRVYERASDDLGMTPAQYRRGAPEEPVQSHLAAARSVSSGSAGPKPGSARSDSAIRPTTSSQPLRASFRTPKSRSPSLIPTSTGSSLTSSPEPRSPISRSTCAAQRSSARSGPSCAGSRAASSAPTSKSPRRSAVRNRSGPSPMPAAQIRPRSLSPATAWFAPMAALAATAGELRASRRSSLSNKPPSGSTTR